MFSCVFFPLMFYFTPAFFFVVQSLSRVRLFAPRTAAQQASLSLSIFSSLLMSIKSVMPSIHLILSPPSPALCLSHIRVFFNESAPHIRWPKYWSFSISPSNEYSALICFGWTGLILLSKRLSRVFSSTTVRKHPFFSTQLSLWSNSHIHT